MPTQGPEWPRMLTQVLLTLIPAILVAVISSVLTVWLSVRKFHSERWWERKAEAYSQIVEALSRLLRSAQNQIDQVEMGQQTPDDDDSRQQRIRRWREANDRIEHMSVVGSFTISEEAATRLKELRGKLQKASATVDENDWYDLACLEAQALEACLQGIRRAAKKDLRVR